MAAILEHRYIKLKILKHDLRIFHTLAAEDKNILFTPFFRHHRHGCKMAVLGRGYFSQHVVESS